MGGTTILVVQIIGVLPYIEGEERLQALHDGVRGSLFLGDDQGTICVGREPDPARAKESHALGLEICHEGIETSPLLVNLCSEETCWCLSSLSSSLELQEIQLMVEYLAGIVEYRTSRYLSNNVLKRHTLIVTARKELVQVVDIGLKVLAMMERQGLGTDHWLQGIASIGEFY